jgi:hypothetical protein
MDILTVPTMELLPSLIFYTSHNAIILNDPNHTLLHIGSLILYIKAKHQLVSTAYQKDCGATEIHVQ